MGKLLRQSKGECNSTVDIALSGTYAVSIPEACFQKGLLEIREMVISAYIGLIGLGPASRVLPARS